ncbi:hypothetical protein GX48_02501 [Paracoccidioides brasiliensis]|nr:hypothetical protein GX48_02501 [Paracoccidioides brasiliensis]
MAPPSDPQSRTSTPRSFVNQTASAEDLLKSQTVGLVHLSDFRKRRAEVLEQKEREAHDKSLGRFVQGNSRSGTPSGGETTDGAESAQLFPKRKKKKLGHFAKSKLSFGDDEVEEGVESSTALTPNTSDGKSPSKTPAEGSPKPPTRRIAPNPNLSIPPPKVVTKSAREAEAQTRDALRREFLALQEKVKATEILIPFVFYDGTNIPVGTVKVKKGDPIWVFLERCRKVAAELGIGGAGGGGRSGRGRKDHRREWARVGVDDLMCVRGNVIIPHHYELYYFIANRVPSFTKAGGLLFDYTNTAPPEPSDDPESQPPQLEGGDMDPTFTKVVDRRWFERNKHIFPASLWREYEPGEDHIFCLQCADILGLSRPTTSERQCPACSASLVNPDDAVATVLTPSEDYKTSVLSGLDPHTIMECAGRALAFWTYQSAQEIFYQEYLGKSLTEKYSALNQQMDKVIHDANSEISNLQNRLSEMQIGQEQLQKKNHELVDIYREKCKKHAQVTNLYNLLKSRAMRPQIQTAASDSVTQVLESLGGGSKSNSSTEDLFRPLTSLATSPRRSPSRYPTTNMGIEQLHRHQRSGSRTATKNGVDSAAMPPPSGIPPSFRSTNMPPSTPQHRTRLLGAPRSSHRAEYQGRPHQDYITNKQSFPVPQRFTSEAVDNRFSLNGSDNYDLNAGIKIGRPSESSLQLSDPRSGMFGT